MYVVPLPHVQLLGVAMYNEISIVGKNYNLCIGFSSA